MGLSIGALNVTDQPAGFYFDRFLAGGPTLGTPEVTGERVLIPGAVGLYTPASAFEVRHMLIRIKGNVWGIGATRALRLASFRTNVASLKTALAVSTRADVTLTATAPIEGLTGATSLSIAAGWLRFESPESLGFESWETVIELDATASPVAWA